MHDESGGKGPCLIMGRLTAMPCHDEISQGRKEGRKEAVAVIFTPTCHFPRDEEDDDEDNDGGQIYQPAKSGRVAVV